MGSNPPESRRTVGATAQWLEAAARNGRATLRPGEESLSSVRPLLLYILGLWLGTPVPICSTSDGKIFLEVDFVWGSEETCAAPYNEIFGERALDRT
jgi:hypothetical protein